MCAKFWRNDEISEITILKIIAHQIFATENPGTIADVPKTNKPFMTRINNPRVTTVMGSVRRTRIGFIKAFVIPSMSPTINAVVIEFILTPGRM